MNEAYKGREQRQYSRISALLEISFSFTSATNTPRFRALTRNISEGGICLLVNERKEEVIEWLKSNPSTMQLELQLTEKDPPLQLPATMVWTNGSTDWLRSSASATTPLLIGVRIHNMPDFLRNQLRDYLSEQFDDEQF